MESKLQIENRENLSNAKASVKNEWFIATAFLLAYGLFNNLFPMGAGLLYKWFNPSITAEAVESFIAIMIALTPILIFCLLAFPYKKMFKEVPIKWSQFKVKDIGIGILITLLIVLSNAIISLIGVQFSYAASSDNQNMINDLSVNFPILIFITTVLIAPIVEEFFYRKLIMGHIFKHYAKTGLLVSSILFGFAHFSIDSLIYNFNPFNILSYIVMGFFFGLIYYKTKRIEASIVTHLINNLMSMSIVFLVM